MSYPNELSNPAQAQWPVVVNENAEALGHAAVYAYNYLTSTGLTWGYFGGRWGGNAVADGTLSLTNAADNYLVANRSTGAITTSTATTNWNDTTNYARCYKVTTAGSVVTATEDHRAGLYGAHGIAVAPGAVGTVTSVDASGGVQTASGSAITATGTIRAAEVFNAQTGVSYTILTGDRGKLLTLSNAGAIAVTLPQAGVSFPDGWFCDVKCVGAGTTTITPTTSTIDGAASVALTTGQSARIVSDGTNYRTVLTGGGAASLSDGDKGDITVSSSGATWTIDNDVVTFAKMQNVNANSVPARAAGTSGDLSEVALAASQLLGRGSTGDVAAIALGSGLSMSGTTLSATASGSGTKTYAVLTPMTSLPPASNYATLDTRNTIAVLDFDASTDEAATWVFVLPEAASLGSGLSITLHWMATSATSGTCRWGVQLERMTTDLDSDSFDTAATGGGTANGTSGILTATTITLTTIDSAAAGEPVRLKVYRDADGTSGTDDMTGDAELVVVEVRSAA